MEYTPITFAHSCHRGDAHGIKRVFLVACAGKMRRNANIAMFLYDESPLFRKARQYVFATRDEWFILSAKHGLLHPREWIEPYDLSMNSLTAPQRKLWAEKVAIDYMGMFKGSATAVLLAGEAYRHFLLPALEQRGIMVSVPMKGLGIGEQMRWLDRECGKELFV